MRRRPTEQALFCEPEGRVNVPGWLLQIQKFDKIELTEKRSQKLQYRGVNRMDYGYSEQQLEALCARDKKLAGTVAKIGPIRREVTPDLFCALCKNIVAQQVSDKAFQTVWGRFEQAVGVVTPEKILKLGAEQIQSFGMSGKKAGYLMEAARRFATGEMSAQTLVQLNDDAFCQALCALPGVGRWTVQMLLIFCLQRPDVISYDDFGIRKGICLLYGLRELTRTQFERYARRYHPNGTLASFYLWAIAGGAGKKKTSEAEDDNGGKR